MGLIVCWMQIRASDSKRAGCKRPEQISGEQDFNRDNSDQDADGDLEDYLY